MDRLTYGFIFLVLPFIIDGMLVLAAGLLAGRRLFVVLILVVYVALNIGLPVWLAATHPDGLSWGFWGVMIGLRIIEFAGMRLHKAWMIAWHGPEWPHPAAGDSLEDR